MIDAARAYLALLKAPPSPAREAVRALARALDRLSIAYHDTTAIDVEDAGDPPILATYDEMRAPAVRAFPDFGFYPVARPQDALSETLGLADAIDDLADIALELLEVEWRWLNNSPADATLAFCLGYRFHWGRHLHDLRGYVHARQFEGSAPIEPLIG